jgi:hypothetical protein
MAWERAGGFFEEMREGFEDWEFWVRLTGLGYRGYQIPEKLIYVRRIEHSFAMSAAEKKETFVEQIKAHDPHLYDDPHAAIGSIRRSYRYVYRLHPFSNLAERLPGSAQMIVSNLDLIGTREWIRLHFPASPFFWVARRVLDEAATDSLYENTPFVYVLPNFLPRYVCREFVQHLRKIWTVASIHTYNPALLAPLGVGVNLAGQ